MISSITSACTCSTVVLRPTTSTFLKIAGGIARWWMRPSWKRFGQRKSRICNFGSRGEARTPQDASPKSNHGRSVTQWPAKEPRMYVAPHYLTPLPFVSPPPLLSSPSSPLPGGGNHHLLVPEGNISLRCGGFLHPRVPCCCREGGICGNRGPPLHCLHLGELALGNTFGDKLYFMGHRGGKLDPQKAGGTKCPNLHPNVQSSPQRSLPQPARPSLSLMGNMCSSSRRCAAARGSFTLSLFSSPGSRRAEGCSTLRFLLVCIMLSHTMSMYDTGGYHLHCDLGNDPNDLPSTQSTCPVILMTFPFVASPPLPLCCNTLGTTITMGAYCALCTGPYPSCIVVPSTSDNEPCYALI